MDRINLVDMDFNSFNADEKRLSFITMDMVMKDRHKNGKMITSFMPQDIYYDKDTTLFYFDKTSDITSYMANSKEDAIKDNVIALSTLAFCSYLKTYNPKDGLLNNAVVAKEFDKFVDVFNPDDVDYYKSVLVDYYNTGNMPDSLYYSDAILKKEQEKSSNGNTKGRALVKATEVGRAMADKNTEAAFGTQFFLVSMVATTILVIVGYIIYILSIL